MFTRQQLTEVLSCRLGSYREAGWRCLVDPSVFLPFSLSLRACLLLKVYTLLSVSVFSLGTSMHVCVLCVYSHCSLSLSQYAYPPPTIAPPPPPSPLRMTSTPRLCSRTVSRAAAPPPVGAQAAAARRAAPAAGHALDTVRLRDVPRGGSGTLRSHT